MIKKLILSQNYLFWSIFHVLLGIASSITSFALIFWFYLVVLTSFFGVVRLKSIFPFIVFITYLTSFELLARMSQTSPFIPYELGKYLLCTMLIFGIFKHGVKNNLGFILILLLTPALFFDLSGEVSTQDLLFNLLGPVNVGLAIWFFYGKTITKPQFIKLLRISLFPLISVLSSAIFKTPSFDEIEFSLGANWATSGGGGTNQVSTLLGVGIFICFLFLINKWKITGYRIADFLLFFLFGLQGLLTFSRGGIIGGVLGILTILFFVMFSTDIVKRRYKLPKLGKVVILASILLTITFQMADSLTGGLLTLRYLGETEGTLAGSKEKSLNSITSGRVNIFMEDIDIWLDNAVLGVGAGASSFMRAESHYYLTHVELSRLLSEHGMLGLIYFILLMYLFIRLMNSKLPPMEKGILVAFFLIALYTTFHAASRTYITPLFIGLSLMKIRLLKIPSKGSKKEIKLHAHQKFNSVL